ITPSSPQLLFYPVQRTVRIEKDACQEAVETIAGRPGLYLKGSIQPALPGVHVTVYVEDDSQNKVGEAETRADGKYSIGPLYDDKKYSLTATKEGYRFEPI